MKISQSLQDALVCPCPEHSALTIGPSELCCGRSGCERRFPVIRDVPVLIDEDRSLFSLADYAAGQVNAGNEPVARKRSWVRRLLSYAPAISKEQDPWGTEEAFMAALVGDKANAKVLVLGALDHRYTVPPGVEVTYTDVVFGPLATMIVDAQAIPFRSETFDGVICAAVLMSVPDPNLCVNEIHRVLKPDGRLYATVAFMQSVCMGRYDFHRFTETGMRRLFRRFSEERSGVNCGPGMALAWATERFVASFSEGRAARRVLRSLIRYGVFWLTWFDSYLVRKRGSFDAASSYYFLGRKSERTLSDREVVAAYRGLSPN